MKKVFVDATDVVQIVADLLHVQGLDVDVDAATVQITTSSMFSADPEFNGIEFPLKDVQGKRGA